MTHEQARKLGLGLTIGIVFLPFVFAWFTLRSGHSRAQRFVSLGWMVLMLVAMANNRGRQERAVAPAVPVVSEPSPRPEPTPSETAMSVNASALWDDYHANEVAADEQYKGRMLLVDGVVASIDKNFLDNIVLRLKSSNPFMTTMATMKDSEKRAAMSLRKGQRVRVLCRGGTMIVGSPTMKDCAFAT